MHRILSVIVGVLVVTSASVLAQSRPASATARPLGDHAMAVIQGTAVDSTNHPLADTLVRLRDARLGRILKNAVTDKRGAYLFKDLDPGNYIVEIVSQDQTTIAATKLISANAGETVITIVRLPFNPSLLGAIFGQAMPAQGAAAAAASGASGVGSLIPGLANQFPQTVIQVVPAIVPIGSPVTEQ